MTRSAGPGEKTGEEQHVVLRTLLAHLATIGSANDAEDHGYIDDADRMRTDSCEAIRSLLAENAFLADLFPELQGELDTQHILGLGWAELHRTAAAHLEAPTGDAPKKQCEVCSELSDREYAFQKYGSDDGNTSLPAAAERLEVVRDFHPYSSRKRQVRRCPGCGTYYLYETDYEYLVNGSEDEEFLTRLTEDKAAEYLDPPPTAAREGRS